MTHHNFTKSDFFDICKESDRVVILNCDRWGSQYRAKVIAAAWSFKDATYDTEFELGIKSLYCSELIYQSDKVAYREVKKLRGKSWAERFAKLDCDLSDLAGIGRPYLSPDGLLFAKNIRVVWDSDDELTGLTGPQCEHFLANP